MALSKPQLGIQSPIKCQLCEQDPKISWKCLECELLMCSACKNNIHPKIKTAGEHRIIAMKDIVSTLSPSKDIVNTPGSIKDSTKVDITVVAEYQTKLESGFHLEIALDDSLWIGDGDHIKGKRIFSSYTGLQKVKCAHGGKRLKVISSFNIEIYDIAVTPDNDLIIATNEPILKQIKNGTKEIVDTVYNLRPYEPLSIHVTRTHKTIVGAYVTSGQGKVIVMGDDGNHEKVYGEGDTKHFSFVYPWRITASSNDNIFVVDRKNEDFEGHVVVVLGQGNIINIYSGHSVTNTKDTPFRPYDLTTTPTDNVIVADMKTSTLHILNPSGQLITYISTKDKGITTPCSIGLAMAGHFPMLYIGTTTVGKGKVYKLNLTGC